MDIFNNVSVGNNEQQNQNQQVETKDEPKLYVQPMEFRSIIETQVTDTSTLAKLVSDLFVPVFPQLRASKIEVGNVPMYNNPGVTVKNFYTTITFDDTGVDPSAYNAPGACKAIEPITSSGKIKTNDNKSLNDTLAMIDFMNVKNGQNNNRITRFRLTKEAQSILKEFMPVDASGRVNFNSCVTDTVIKPSGSIGFSPSVPAVSVSIDLRKVIAKIYGSADVNNKSNKYSYIISIGSPIKPMNNMGFANANEYAYRVFITRSHNKNIKDFIASLGFSDSSYVR